MAAGSGPPWPPTSVADSAGDHDVASRARHQQVAGPEPPMIDRRRAIRGFDPGIIGREERRHPMSDHDGRSARAGRLTNEFDSARVADRESRSIHQVERLTVRGDQPTEQSSYRVDRRRGIDQLRATIPARGGAHGIFTLAIAADERLELFTRRQAAET